MRAGLAVASLLVVSVALASANAARSDDTAPTLLRYVRTIKTLVDTRALSNRSTFTQASLRRRFGAQVPIIETVLEQQRWSTEFQSDEGHVPPMLFVTMDRHRPSFMPAGAPPECRVGVVVREATSDLAFDRVVESLGPGWRRDPKAEQQREFDAKRAAPAEPALPASALMGNATIVYVVPHGWMRLDFGPSGLLSRLTSEQVPC